MKHAAGLLLVLGLTGLTGCRTARDVAVTSFRVIDAPANYLRRHLDEPRHTTTTTTTTSDVTYPGQPVDTAPLRTTAATTPRHTSTNRPSHPANADAPRSTSTPAAPPRSAGQNSQPQYPTAKPVPGKPGFVFSPYDPSGGYVDVTGYASGSKAKDPYTQKIFIVP